MDNKTNKKLISNGSSYHKKKRRWKGFRERDCGRGRYHNLNLFILYIKGQLKLREGERVRKK